MLRNFRNFRNFFKLRGVINSDTPKRVSRFVTPLQGVSRFATPLHKGRGKSCLLGIISVSVATVGF